MSFDLDPVSVSQHVMEQLDSCSFDSMNERDILLWIAKVICHGERDQAKIATAFNQESKQTVQNLTKANGATFNSIGSVAWQGLGLAVNAGGLLLFGLKAKDAGVKAAQAIMTATQTGASLTQMPANYCDKWNESVRDGITSRRQAVSEGGNYWSQQNSEAGQKGNTSQQKLDEILRADSEGKRSINQ